MSKGILTVCRLRTPDGEDFSIQKAVDCGLLKPVGRKPAGWGFERHEVPLGYNTMVDNGRQLLAYMFGGRTPMGSYACSKFGLGTGTGPTTVAMTDLQSPINFFQSGSVLLPTKAIDKVDFPVPFVARVQFTVATDEAVQMLITELGLYATDMDTGANTLLARKTITGFPKTSALAPTFIWRVRF